MTLVQVCYFRLINVFMLIECDMKVLSISPDERAIEGGPQRSLNLVGPSINVDRVDLLPLSEVDHDRVG